MNKPAILAIGTSAPPRSITQDQAREIACSLETDAGRHRGIRALYRRAGVRRRGSVLCDERGEIDFYAGGQPTTAERMARYAEHAGVLARHAAAGALEHAAVAPGSITHVVTASCTGFHAPGVDQWLVHGLGLPLDVGRVNVGFMGCHAAINALSVASALVSSDPAARVLVCCVELCSLHFASDGDAERQVANALFADGAAAAVLARSDHAPAKIGRFASRIIPRTDDLMTWAIGDEGFSMRLSPKVPIVLARHVPGWVRGWLGDAGLTPGDVPSWAIHPGGPRVLSSVLESLEINEEAGRVSRDVLAGHGNMSSPTVLWIIDRLLRGGGGLPMAAMAFGPGLACEGMLLTTR